MRRFRHTSHDVPGLNTASLPDLVFTVLFFFMIVTHIRDTEMKVDYDVPESQHVERAESKRGTIYVYIGTPTAHNGNDKAVDTRIQVDDRLATIDEIPAIIRQERSRMTTEDASRLTVCIKADRQTRMAVIEDVKRALSQAGVRRVMYAAEKK